MVISRICVLYLKIEEYIGTDMLSGKGVDIVQDMTDDFAGLSEKSLIISVLGQYFI